MCAWFSFACDSISNNYKKSFPENPVQNKTSVWIAMEKCLKKTLFMILIIRIGNILQSKYIQISKNLYESQMTLNTVKYKFIHRESNSRLCYWAVCQGFVYEKRNVYLYQVSANVQFRGGYGWIHKADKSTRENAKIKDKNDQAEMKENAFFSGSWSVLNLDVQDIFLFLFAINKNFVLCFVLVLQQEHVRKIKLLILK